MKHLLYIFVFLSITFSSCKIKYSLNGATIPIEAKTVTIGYFTNNSTLGNAYISQKFTERLKDVIASQTNLALMKQNGDLLFEGSIIDYNVAPVAIQSNDKAAQNRLTITVKAKYTNKFDVTKSFEDNFSRFKDFDANKAISTVENELLNEIYRQIIEDIFNKAFNNW